MLEGAQQTVVQPNYSGVISLEPLEPWTPSTGESGAPAHITHITTSQLNELQLAWIEELSATAVEPVKYVVPDGVLAGLQQIYRFEQPLGVAEFLKAHPFLVNILLEAYPKVTAVFGEGVMATLRLLDEPDFPCESELFGVIQTDLPPEEALRRLNALDEEWWLEASPRARSRLNFTVEYV